MRDATLSAPALNAGRPARPAPGPRAGSAGGSRPKKRPGSTRRLSARLSVIVGSAGFCAIMIGIVINATMFQKGHHPAPLFASAAPARPAVAEPPPAVVPLAVAPPLASPAMPAAVDNGPMPPATGTARAPAGSGVAVLSKAGPRRHVDGIARLLGTLGDPAPSKTARTVTPIHAGKAAVPVVN